MKLLIKGGKLVDFKNNCFIIRDILIKDKMIERVERNIRVEADYQVIKATGYYVAPGLIDAHVHLREPGFENKETIESGTKACAKGGYTHVFSMPNTIPKPDSVKNIRHIQKLIDESAVIKVTPIASVTFDGETKTDFKALSKENIAGFSDDGSPVNNPRFVYEMLHMSQTTGKALITHSEDLSTFKVGAVNRGKVSEYFGVDGIPNEAEYNMIERDIEILRETGGHLHICHVSTKESVQLIKKAKWEGLNITCEVTPHHLSLTEDCLLEKKAFGKVNPPLRTQEDVDAMIAGILDGTIDMIATDHAPHEIDSKLVSIDKASYGFSGTEIAFNIAYTYLVKTRIINLIELYRLMSFNPAKVFNLENEGNIKENYYANLVLMDLSKNIEVDASKFVSKGKNSPFDGETLNGSVAMTIFEGKIVFKEGNNEF